MFVKSYYCAIWNSSAFADHADVRHTCVGAGYFAARSGREAAAKAYADKIGPLRVLKLKELKELSPTSTFLDDMMEAELNTRTLAAAFGQVDNWIGRCFFLDNSVETWYVRVEDAPTNRRLKFRVFACNRLPLCDSVHSHSCI